MQTVVVGTAGHIDHGKSALVKALTGTDPDRLKEEQERGITIDLGFAHVEAGDLQLAFVDVPGHERFVRNMLAGAGGIDAVLLVVDAVESVMPQTREHFEICRLLGIDRGVIALTKTDVAGPEAIERARAEVEGLVSGSFLAGAPVLEVSARSGAGLSALREMLTRLAGRPSRQARAGIVRLPIDRAFTIKGFGAVVTGTLVSGEVGEGDTLMLLPDRRPVRVRGVQVHGRHVMRAGSPSRVALNLAGLEVRDLHRGQTLASDGTLSVTKQIDVRIELLPGSRPLRHGARIRVHHAAAEMAATVSVAALQPRGADEWSIVSPGEPRAEVRPGGRAFARLKLDSPAAVTRGDRMVLRAGSPLVTVAGAVVLDPEPPRSGIRRAPALARFQALASPDVPISLLIEESAEAGLGAADLVRRWGQDPAGAAALVAQVVEDGRAVQMGERLVSARVIDSWTSRIIEILDQYHREHPEEIGTSRGELLARAGSRLTDPLLTTVLTRLAGAGRITMKDRVSLAGRVPSASPAQQRLSARVEEEIRAGGLTPPDPTAIGSLVAAAPGAVDQAIRGLLREGRLVRAGEILFHREALARLREDVQATRSGQPPGTRVTLDVATFKARFNLTRKHAIPLLEWLDRERVTRRVGETRIVL